MSAEFKDFIKKCTIVDASSRPSAAELLQHPFLNCATDFSQMIPLALYAREEASKAAPYQDSDEDLDEYDNWK